MEGGAAKRLRRRRDFIGATAIDRERHFFVQWKDFEQCLELLAEKRKWLLITGPFQSGKSSLAYALAEATAAQGWITFVTTITADMIDIANSTTLTELEASNGFFNLLAEAIEIDSGGKLTRSRPSETPHGGMTQVTRMLRSSQAQEPDVIWFIDEAGLLNEITRPSIIRALLSGLRACKEQSRSRGTVRLRSFSLVGTARTQKLLASVRQERVRDIGEPYVASSPARGHDPYNPFPPGLPISPLSVETKREEDYLREEDILTMLQDYGCEHGVSFRMKDGEGPENERALHKLAADIYDLTAGYKGLVGSCCEYLQGNNILSLARWKQDVRNGTVANYVLNLKVYSRIVSNIATYSEQLKQLILDCVSSPSAGVAYSDRDRDLLLPAINDGVLAVDPSGSTVSISSGILLAAILEECNQAYTQEVPVVDTFEDAVRASFRYMNPQRLSMDGQPSEYIWQSQFLLGLKLVLEKGYRKRKYTILVECKKRNKHGQRRVRVDFYLKSNGSPPKAFEVQGKGNAQSIIEHMKRSDKYRLLFAGCEMNYVYLVVGRDEEAKSVIESESSKYDQVKCWFVQYLEEDKVWNVEQLQDSGWHSVRLGVPSSYPQFKFATRQF